MNEITKEWIDKAEGDYKVAVRELKDDDPVYDAILYHLQQCVEKYLKALFQEHQIELEKVHDLTYLAEKVKPHVNLTNHYDELTELSEWAVKARYPGAKSTHKEAQTSLRTCEKVRSIIRTSLGLPDETPDV
ncbi:MAG: HEPN domain-containing protein [bacterium]